MSAVVVLGAGLQGVSTALALAAAGRRVILIDREPRCLSRASLHAEGKIHLGFVYANDRTARTSALMLDSALAFGPLLEAWIGAPLPWTALTGLPFSYLILSDTLVPAGQLLDAWRRLEGEYGQRRRGRATTYLGRELPRLWWHAGTTDPLRQLVSGRVADITHTAELALDMSAFRSVIEARVSDEPRIRCLFDHDVREVERTAQGFRVRGVTREAQGWTEQTDTVVNCLWEGRLAIDRQLGLLPARPWVYRLKCRLHGRLPARLTHLPSLTLMCGRFGDVVNFGGGRAYLSWYPACLRGWSSGVEIPPDWDRIMRGDLRSAETEAITAQSLEAFDSVIPGLGQCEIDSVAAGVIFSWGETDIDDPGSELHRRDEIGPEAHDGYITVNTGKLTSAPLFAKRIANLVTSRDASVSGGGWQTRRTSPTPDPRRDRPDAGESPGRP